MEYQGLKWTNPSKCGREYGRTRIWKDWGPFTSELSKTSEKGLCPTEGVQKQCLLAGTGQEFDKSGFLRHFSSDNFERLRVREHYFSHNREQFPMSQASSDKATPGRLTVTLTSSHSHLALNKWCMATIIWMISRSLSIGQIYKAVCHILRDVLAYTAHCTTVERL